MFSNNNSVMDYILQRLREVICEVVTEILCEHFKKDRYYSLSYDPNKILNLEEAAEYCGVCTRTLVTRVREGKLKQGGTGRNYRFRVGDLDAFMFNERK